MIEQPDNHDQNCEEQRDLKPKRQTYGHALYSSFHIALAGVPIRDTSVSQSSRCKYL